MKKRIGAVGALGTVLVLMLVVSTVFAAGVPADWVLRDRSLVAENFSLGVQAIGGSDRAVAQSKEEQCLLNFHLTSTWGTSGFAPEVGYSNFRLSLQEEGGAIVSGLRMVVMRSDQSDEVFLPDGGTGKAEGGTGKAEAGVIFLSNKAIEPTSGGPLDIWFCGLAQGEGKVQYTFRYEAVDQFGHVVVANTVAGTITVEGQDWLVGTSKELKTALEQVLPGDAILLAKTWLNLSNPPVDPDPAGLTVYGSGMSETLLVGQLRLGEHSTLQDLWLYNGNSHEREGTGFTYTETAALRTRGSVTIKGVLVSGPNSWASMGSSDRGWDVQNQILVEDSVFIGTKVGNPRSGLSLDVYHEVNLENPVIRNNVFIGQQCGIDISIDVVFGDIPTNEGRLEAFREYSATLEAANTFVNVDQPVCGARG